MQLTDEQFSLLKDQFRTLKDRSPFYAKKFAHKTKSFRRIIKLVVYCNNRNSKAF